LANEQIGRPAGEVVLVTGASSGIGAELARVFAREGATLVLVARSAGKLGTLAGELSRDHGVRVSVVPADLAVPGAARRVYDRLEAEGIRVDVLVNNAGFGFRGPFVQIDAQAQVDMIQVNVAAPTHLARLFLPGMIERGRGGILNVASAAGFQPGPWMNVYYATKAYLLHFSEALADEVSGSGVTVTCLAPGPTRTGFGELADMEATRLFKLGTMTAAEVAEAGHRAFRRGHALVVPGIRNGIIPYAARITPRFLMRKIAGYLNR
jgi:short-subunit dehydrogenase